MCREYGRAAKQNELNWLTPVDVALEVIGDSVTSVIELQV